MSKSIFFLTLSLLVLIDNFKTSFNSDWNIWTSSSTSFNITWLITSSVDVFLSETFDKLWIFCIGEVSAVETTGIFGLTTDTFEISANIK